MVEQGSSGRAVSLAVTRFPEDEDGGLPDLRAFGSYAADLAVALGRLGYDSELVKDPAHTVIGARLVEMVAPERAGARVVHVLSHGHRDDETGAFYVIGSDGTWSFETSVGHWLHRVTESPQAPHTLFLLDLCYSGTPARAPWPGAGADGARRAWVIAASEPHRLAYDARFTKAAAKVLLDLESGRLDVYGNQEYVSLDVVAKAISREVDQLVAVGESGQRVTATRSDISADLGAVPFFPNPHYDPRRTAVRGGAEPAVESYVDEVLDVVHWQERSAGQERTAGRSGAGCFTGRAQQLDAVLTWLRDPDAAAPPVRAVTGSPGSGKSALLGIVVCAIHRALSERTTELWSPVFGLAGAPSVNPHLAALHARQRDVPAIRASLAGQLELKPPPGRITSRRPAELDWSADELREALRTRKAQPVVVLDALDEAADPRALLHGFVLPLLETRRPDGRPVARVLLGVRHGPMMTELTRAAGDLGGPGWLVDLDADLRAYVGALLRLNSVYQNDAYERARSAFSASVAKALVGRRAVGGGEWGEFLVAALHTNRLTAARRPVSDPVWAALTGRQVPATLSAVLEADLGARAENAPWLRALLGAVALARGEGMPLTVLTRVAASLEPGRPVPSIEEMQRCLDEARFYLRQAPDTDGTTLYRLFHQGLADHLGETARPGPLLDTLAGLERRWQTAEPYVLRNAVHEALAEGRMSELATDPAFLLHADAATLLPALDRLEGDGAPGMLERSVLRTSAHLHRAATPALRRDVLALDAARWNAPDLVRGAHEVPLAGRPPSGWRPAWATGSSVTPALHATLTGLRDRPNAVAFTTVAEGTQDVLRIISAGDDRQVRIWDPAGQRLIGQPLEGHRGAVNAVAPATVEGLPAAVTAGAGGELRLWDVAGARPLAGPAAVSTRALLSVAVARLDGRAVAVTGAAGGEVRLWDLERRAVIGDPFPGHAADVVGVAFAEEDDGPVVVTVDSLGVVRIWDLDGGPSPRAELPGHEGLVTGVVCARVGDRSVAVTAGRDGTVRLWDVRAGTAWGSPMRCHTKPIRALACHTVNGRAVALTAGDDQTVRLWDLADRAAIGNPLVGHSAPVHAVAGGHDARGRPVAVSAGADLTLRLWDLGDVPALGDPVPGHTESVRAVAADGAVIVTAGDDLDVRHWDVRTGCPAGPPLAGHDTPVLAAAAVPGGGTVTGDAGGLLRRWPGGGAVYAHSGPIHSIACTLLSGRPVAVTVGADRGVRVWRLDEEDPDAVDLAVSRADRHRGAVRAVACAGVDGAHLAVTGGDDGQIRLWDLGAGGPLVAKDRGLAGVLNSRGEPVRAVACTRLGDIPVAVTGGGGTSIRVWDLRTGSGVLTLGNDLSPVLALACAEPAAGPAAGPVAVSAHADRTVAIWDLARERPAETVAFPGVVNSLAATVVDGALHVAAAVGRDVATLVPAGHDLAPGPVADGPAA